MDLQLHIDDEGWWGWGTKNDGGRWLVQRDQELELSFVDEDGDIWRR